MEYIAPDGGVQLRVQSEVQVHVPYTAIRVVGVGSQTSHVWDTLTRRGICPISGFVKTAEINSMTGYGSTVFEVSGEYYTLELRSVNSRHVDVRVRLPWHDVRLDSLLTAAAKQGLHRGRLEISILSSASSGDRAVDTLVSIPDPGMLEAEARAGAGQGAVPEAGPLADEFRQAHVGLSSLCKELGLDEPLQAQDVLGYMTACIHEEARTGMASAPPDFSNRAMAALQEAQEGLQIMRRREGKLMGMAIGEQMAEAASMVTQLERIAAEQPRRLGEKLRDRVTHTLEALGEAKEALDKGRLTAEIAVYVDRADVTEELVRLRAHFAHFAEIMAGDPPHGRKMDFLLQEMFREINTTGAKSHDSRSNNLVVNAKSVFEKIREVVQNVE